MTFQNDNFIILSGRSDNLLLNSLLVTFIQMNGKRNAIANAICVNYTLYLI